MLVDESGGSSGALPGETVEAETGLLSGLFSVASDPTASGGQYVSTPDAAFSSTPGSDFAEYRFFVPAAGNYRLDGVVDGPDFNSDSFFVTVDGQPAAGYLWAIPSGWTPDQMGNRGVEDPVILSLGAGEHVIRVHLREGGSRLDSLVLVDLNPAPPPALAPATYTSALDAVFSDLEMNSRFT